MKESIPINEPSPYKAPSKAEKAWKTRNLMILPLCAVPIGISAYFAFGKENSNGLNWFSWHPFMMMTAFFSLGGSAILTKKIGGRDNTMIHAYLMSAASLAAGFGGYVIWTNKEMYNKPHFTTNHGQFGALTAAWMVIYSLPTYILYNPDNGLLRQNVFFRTVHKYSGKLLIAMGLVTCAYGIVAMEKDGWKAGALIASLLLPAPVFLL